MELIDKSTLVVEIEKEIKDTYAGREYVGIPSWDERKIDGLEKAIEILNTLEVKETGTVWHSFDEVLPPQSSDICVYWDRDKIITTGIWEESEKPKYASKWAYTSDLLNK